MSELYVKKLNAAGTGDAHTEEGGRGAQGKGQGCQGVEAAGLIPGQAAIQAEVCAICFS